MGQLTDLIGRHQSALGEAADKMQIEDLRAQVLSAVRHYSRRRPARKRVALTLVVGQEEYAAPADLITIESAPWGAATRRGIRPWEPCWQYVERLPAITPIETSTGRYFYLAPAPTLQQISILGAEYPVIYQALWTVADDSTSNLPAAAEALVLLRAEAEAVRQLAQSGVVTPIQTHRGLIATSHLQTPLALYEALLKEWAKALEDA